MAACTCLVVVGVRGLGLRDAARPGRHWQQRPGLCRCCPRVHAPVKAPAPVWWGWGSGDVSCPGEEKGGEAWRGAALRVTGAGQVAGAYTAGATPDSEMPLVS